jgi:hypothetical protein
MSISFRKYLLYSGIATWAIILLIAVIATFVHQVKFQDSPQELHLNRNIDSLRDDLAEVEQINKYYYETIMKLTYGHPYCEEC